MRSERQSDIKAVLRAFAERINELEDEAKHDHQATRTMRKLRKLKAVRKKYILALLLPETQETSE